MTDETLDRELAAAVNVDPSPEFLARVRTRIAADSPAQRTGGWIPRLAWAAALVLVVGAFGVWRSAPADSPAAQASVEADLQVGLAPVGRQQASVEADLQVGLAPRQSPAARIADRPRASDAPPFADVIVSIEHRRAFEQLVDAAENGRLPAFMSETDPDNPFGIAPIEVEPLTLTDLRIGEPAEGEERP